MQNRAAQCFFVVLCLCLFACKQKHALEKQWQTNIPPIDKPSVNFTVAENAVGELNMVKIVLRAENPIDGRVIEREMGFIVTGRTKDKIFLELKEVPGEVIGIQFPAKLDASFEAKMSNGQNPVEEQLLFRQLKQ
jgi:hypothetical protein